jgi:hypothetical protein
MPGGVSANQRQVVGDGEFSPLGRGVGYRLRICGAFDLAFGSQYAAHAPREPAE